MKRTVIALTLTLAGVASAQPTIVLDSFEDQFDGSGTGGALVTSGSNPEDETTQTGLASVLMGQRFAELEQLSGVAGSTGTISAGDGMLSLNTGPQVAAALTLEYDLGSFDVTGGGGLDALEFDVVFADAGQAGIGPVLFDVTLNDGVDSSTRRVSLSSSVDAGTGPLTLSFDLQAFADEGVSLTAVESVRFVFGADGTAADTTIGPISFVPSPPSAAAVGLVGLLGARRRRGSAG